MKNWNIKCVDGDYTSDTLATVRASSSVDAVHTWVDSRADSALYEWYVAEEA